MGTPDRNEFGAYLRLRRSLLAAPETATSGRASRRRVPGMRRQEIAALANISVEYYTRLEQGRALRPSREILAALSCAFDLTAVERDHLHRLARAAPLEPPVPEGTIRPGLLRMLSSLDDTMPVTVHDGRLDLLACNRAATELLAPLMRGGAYGRNVVYQAFTATDLPALLGDDGAELFLAVAAAELRTALSRYPNDRYLHEIRGNLASHNAVFRDHWGRGDVSTRKSAMKDMRHPARGWARFDIEMLHDPGRDHWIMFYTPVSPASSSQ